VERSVSDNLECKDADLADTTDAALADAIVSMEGQRGRKNWRCNGQDQVLMAKIGACVSSRID
jgi:hypothetical protein